MVKKNNGLFFCKKKYWLKKPNIADIFFVAINAVFSTATIYYDEKAVTPRTLKFIHWLRNIWQGFDFLPAYVDFNAKDVDGLNQRHRASYNLNQMAYSFLLAYLPDASEREKQMVITYLWGYIADKIQFVTLIAERIKHLGDQNCAIYIESGPMNAMIADFFATQGIVVRSGIAPGQQLRQRLVPFIYFWLVLWAAIFPRKDKSSISTIKPAVWVEFYYPWRNEHAFWRKHIQDPQYDLVYYLDRNDTPIEADTIADIKSRGMKWIDTHTLPIIRMSRFSVWKAWHFLLRYLFPSQLSPLWFRVFQFQERAWYSIYESVFKRYQVKILFQHQDLGWKQAVQARAIEEAGGIMIGYHWSNLPHCWENVYLTSQHVYFVWGSAMRNCLEKKKNTCQYILPSGIWTASDIGEDRPKELDGFFGKLDFIFSIFDSDVAHYWIMTPETLSLFFLKILDLLEKQLHWGAILKTKSSSLERYAEVLPGGREIVDRMKALQKQGRFVIFNHQYLPMVAMAYSHLGVCYTLNTAGIIFGIYGHRAIHWECVGIENPISADSTQQILYKSLDDLGEAILRASKGDLAIGDFSKWRKWVNYFGDYEGDKRVAWFVQTFMDNISQTNDYKKSLDDSVGHYNEQYQVGMDFYESIIC